MSSIDARMLAEPGEPVDHVRLPRNPCGAVLGGYVAADRVDTEGRSIPSDLVVTELHIQVAGSPIDADAMGNLCDPQGIANPDNLTFLPGFDLLTIGEDTALHPVASLWVQHPQTRELTRIAVAPRGGEVTGIHWIPDLRGFGYLTLAIQHPWGELNGPAPAGLTDADKRSYTGYIGPFPSLKR